MDHRLAQQMYDSAMAHLKRTRPDVLEAASKVGPQTLGRLTAQQFLEEYCWVIYASGFRFSTLEKIFPRIRQAFSDFNLACLIRMRSIKPVLSVFNNDRKARSFLQGSNAIASEGFDNFKKRVVSKGICVLEALPGLGPITKFHLAKNIGLVDKAKPDIWLVRAAKACDSTVDELVEFLSESNHVKQHVVDVALWHYGADGKLGKSVTRRTGK